MTKEEALNVEEVIREYCGKVGLWVAVEHEYRPHLKMIRIKEISIKVDQEQ